MSRFFLLSFFLLVLPAAAFGRFITIEPLPPPIPPDLPYGEIVREIRIEGNAYTREAIIRLALKTEIGQPLTEDDAAKDVLWVMRMGAFTAVTLTTERVEDGIALVVVVAEATPYIPALSVRITQENGVEAGPALASTNLFGIAARLSAYARFGGTTNLGLRYAGPPLARHSWLFSHSLEYFHRNRLNELLNFDETTDELALEFVQAVTGEARLGLRCRYTALKASRDGFTLDADNRDHVPAVGVFLQNDSRNGVYPTGGWYLDVEASKWGVLGGDGDFWRLDADARLYRRIPFLDNRHSLALTSYASLTSGNVGTSIPPWSEFYIGGTNSVRGWSLGSRHGQHQWLNTVEYWFRIMEQRRWQVWFVKWRMGVQLGVFGDFGTAWSDDGGLAANMIAGGGAGLRLTVPVITMFRMDLAFGEDSMGIRFQIGGAEKAIAQKARVR